MLTRRRTMLAMACAALLPGAPARAQEKAQDKAQDKLHVIASFSILGDLVKNVGGERLQVGTLVGPNGNAHVYAPSPGDAKSVADAKLAVNQKTLDLALIGPRKEEINENEARLRANEAQSALLRQQLADAQLIAPVDAVVRSRVMEPGEMASPQKPVFSLAVTDPQLTRIRPPQRLVFFGRKPQVCLVQVERLLLAWDTSD